MLMNKERVVHCISNMKTVQLL